MSGGGHENQTGDLRYAYPRDGFVVDRNDPKKLGRVRVKVPGLLEPASAWAFPCGSPGGGSPQLGFKWTPEVDAHVVVIFIGGDPENLRVFPGHWGITDKGTEMPTDTQNLSDEDTPQVHSLETNAYAITIDDRPGKESLILKHKASGDSIEHDAGPNGPGWQITASAAVNFQVDGIFNVDAATITFNGRKLGEGPQQI